jgi:hypothetical protein
MRRLVLATLVAILVAALAPMGAAAQEVRGGIRTEDPSTPSTGRPPAPRPRPHRSGPFFFPCCVDTAYLPAQPPEPAPPPILYVLPSAPTLIYIAPARVEPAPEVQLPTGRWERHGNGKEYPYTWVWVGIAGSPPLAARFNR